MFSITSGTKNYLLHGRRRLWIFVALALIVLLLIWYWSKDDDEEVIHTTTAVVRGDIENLVTATGILQPRDYVDVGAQVSGQLKVLHVQVGSEVQTGDLLAEIDATVYLAKVDASRAQLRNQRAQLLDRQAQLKLAEINYTRQKNLDKEDATTQESLESAEASLQSAKAQITALEAQIEQIESSLRAEEANLEFARIYAPMDGTVVSITSRQGQTLNTNQMAPTLLRIADLSVMTVQAQVSEADVGKLRQNMPVYFTTLGSEGRRWHSQLDRIEPTPTVLNNVVLYNALFDVPNANRLLMTQMTTQVFFVIADAKDALMIPMAALNFGSTSESRSQSSLVAGGNPAEVNSSPQPHNATNIAQGEKTTINEAAKTNSNSHNSIRHFTSAPRTRNASVRVMKPRGIIESRPVKVGVTNRVQAEILSGLAEGELVVTGMQKPKKLPGGNSQSFGPGQPRMMR